MGNKLNQGGEKPPTETLQIGDRKVPVLRLENNMTVTRTAIERRLRFAETTAGLQPGQGISLDESAYAALEKITERSIGPCLEILRLAIEMKAERGKRIKYPCVITGEDIDRVGITAGNLESM